MDGRTHVEDHLLVGRAEVQICREPPGLPRRHFRRLVPPLKISSVVEEAFVGEHEEDMILCDVEQRRPVRIGAASAVKLHEGASETGRHCYAFPPSRCQGQQPDQ